MNCEWTQIHEDYKKAKLALWCPKHVDKWSRDEETGYYYMWKAYQEARSAETKDHLLYARILVMMSHERRFRIDDYVLFHKYVGPALDEYRQAIADGQRPTEKELGNAQWEYDALFYQESRADAPYDEQIQAIRGHEKLSEFFFYESQVISFSHSEHNAKLTLQYRSAIATFSFDDVYEIQINADPAVVWVTEFCCYPCFEDKSRIRFDIGDYKITCKAVCVESVEFDAHHT